MDKSKIKLFECKGTLAGLIQSLWGKQFQLSGLFYRVCEGQAGNFFGVKKAGEYEQSDTSNPFSLSNYICINSHYFIFPLLYLSLSGFNPMWEETLVFTLHMPDIALIRFLVWDHDPIGQDFIGQRTIAFNSMIPGTKFVCILHFFSYKKKIFVIYQAFGIYVFFLIFSASLICVYLIVRLPACVFGRHGGSFHLCSCCSEWHHQ